jgi:hypothetical protein
MKRKYTPEQRLFIEVIKQAIIDKDIRYLKSQYFEIHCFVCNLDYEKLYEMLEVKSIV